MKSFLIYRFLLGGRWILVLNPDTSTEWMRSKPTHDPFAVIKREDWGKSWFSLLLIPFLFMNGCSTGYYPPSQRIWIDTTNKAKFDFIEINMESEFKEIPKDTI